MEGLRTKETSNHLNRKRIAIRGSHHCARRPFDALVLRTPCEPPWRSSTLVGNFDEHMFSGLASSPDSIAGDAQGIADSPGLVVRDIPVAMTTFRTKVYSVSSTEILRLSVY